MHQPATHATIPQGTLVRPRAGVVSMHGGALVVALLLAACAQSPRAAVTPQHGAGAVALAAPQMGCAGAEAERAALNALERDLRSQGLALTATCQSASGGWAVRVRVMDGMKASQVVRGPLADGHDVDMGTPAGVDAANAALAATGFSPDVEHNRQWLQAQMARHQFNNLPDAWWHFTRRGAGVPSSADTDLAIR